MPLSTTTSCRILTGIRTKNIRNLLTVHPIFFGYFCWETNMIVDDPEWTKEETDYLFQLIEDYDSRFIVVHDRYEFPGGAPRSIEVRITLLGDTGSPRSDPNKGPERQILQHLSKARDAPALEWR